MFSCSSGSSVRRLFGGIGIICFGGVFAVGVIGASPNDAGLKHSFVIQVKTSRTTKHCCSYFSLQLLLIAASMGITASSAVSLQAKKGLPILNQISGWSVLGTPFYRFNFTIALN